MKPLVIIPARGGSKRLPGKNIKLLKGKPLIHYTIEAAREVFDDSVICVSTDDEEIKRVSECTGLKVPFIRPSELATDSADSRSVLLHAHEFYKKNKNYEADTVILLQPTSPLRKGDHIKDMLDLYHEDLDMVVSVKETNANPYFVLYEESEEGLLKKSKEGNFTRKQDVPKVWELNGAIYIISAESLIAKQTSKFEKVVKYIMPALESIDIDTELDWIIAEAIFEICD